jgi:hypothetical protein
MADGLLVTLGAPAIDQVNAGTREQVGRCARCVPDGLAALPGFPVPVVAVSGSSPPMSAGHDAAAAFGQHTARLPRSCHSW